MWRQWQPSSKTIMQPARAALPKFNPGRRQDVASPIRSHWNPITRKCCRNILQPLLQRDAKSIKPSVSKTTPFTSRARLRISKLCSLQLNLLLHTGRLRELFSFERPCAMRSNFKVTPRIESLKNRQSGTEVSQRIFLHSEIRLFFAQQNHAETTDSIG